MVWVRRNFVITVEKRLYFEKKKFHGGIVSNKNGTLNTIVGFKGVRSENSVIEAVQSCGERVLCPL